MPMEPQSARLLSRVTAITLYHRIGSGQKDIPRPAVPRPEPMWRSRIPRQSIRTSDAVSRCPCWLYVLQPSNTRRLGGIQAPKPMSNICCTSAVHPPTMEISSEAAPPGNSDRGCGTLPKLQTCAKPQEHTVQDRRKRRHADRGDQSGPHQHNDKAMRPTLPHQHMHHTSSMDKSATQRATAPLHERSPNSIRGKMSQARTAQSDMFNARRRPPTRCGNPSQPWRPREPTPQGFLVEECTRKRWSSRE